MSRRSSAAAIRNSISGEENSSGSSLVMNLLNNQYGPPLKYDYGAHYEDEEDEEQKPELKKRLLNDSLASPLIMDLNEPNIELEEFEHGIEDFGSFFRIKTHDFCGFCNKYFDDSAKFLTHGDCYFLRRQVEAINGGKPVHITADGRNWIFKCEFDGCVKSGSSRSYVSEHYAFHFEQKYVCKFCGKRAHSNSNIRKHISSLHVHESLPG